MATTNKDLAKTVLIAVFFLSTILSGWLIYRSVMRDLADPAKPPQLPTLLWVEPEIPSPVPPTKIEQVQQDIDQQNSEIQALIEALEQLDREEW